MSWIRTAARVGLLLGVTCAGSAAGAEAGSSGHGAPAPAHDPAGHGAATPRPAQSRRTLPVNPVSLIEGSRSAWSVSDTAAGCYLMSPSRRNSSRVAIGRHPELGPGLFAVDIALSVPGPAQTERIAVQTADGMLEKDGRMVGAALLFMPLRPPEMDQALRTLSEGGPLWLVIRDAWLTHAGLDVAAAIADFHRQCDQKPATPMPTAKAPVAAVGSKSASSH